MSMGREERALDYDQMARDYARHRSIHPGVLAALIEESGISASSRVLEVGCGTGNYLSAIAERVGCRCAGIDPSAGMLATARERHPEIVWMQGRAESLPFEDRSFDLVYSVDVIHHVADRLAYFREARRVLVPEGRVCTVTDSEDDIARRRPLSSHFPETVAVELTRYPRIGALRREMEEARIGEIEARQTEIGYELTGAEALQPYRDRAYSSLHLIDNDAFSAGLARLSTELEQGPVKALSLYTLLWGRRLLGWQSGELTP